MRDEAYNILREWITFGKLKPDEKLKDQDLSERLGISRTPIREALLRLERDEFVVSKPNSWTMVAPIDIENAKEVYSIVATLEEYALKESILKIEQSSIIKLTEINEQLYDALKDAEHDHQAIELDNQFHEELVLLAGNKELEKLLKKT